MRRRKKIQVLVRGTSIVCNLDNVWDMPPVGENNPKYFNVGVGGAKVCEIFWFVNRVDFKTKDKKIEQRCICLNYVKCQQHSQYYGPNQLHPN